MEHHVGVDGRKITAVPERSQHLKHSLTFVVPALNEGEAVAHTVDAITAAAQPLV